MRLQGLKQIASYLETTEKTVARYRDEFGLPVYRRGGRYHAYAEEIDDWRDSTRVEKLDRRYATWPVGGAGSGGSAGTREMPRRERVLLSTVRHWRSVRALVLVALSIAAVALLLSSEGPEDPRHHGALSPVLTSETGLTLALHPERGGTELRNSEGHVIWFRKNVGSRQATLFRGDAGVRVAAIRSGQGDFDRYNELTILSTEVDRQEEPTIFLPRAKRLFSGYSDRFQVSSVVPLDLDRDGLDELLITYRHITSHPAFTLLYEPASGDCQFVYASLGHHWPNLVVDVDEDGRRDLVFWAIANDFGWLSEVTAVQLVPEVGSSSGIGVAARTLALSPTLDIREPVGDSRLWTNLLPSFGCREQCLDWIGREGVIRVRDTSALRLGRDGTVIGPGSQLSNEAREAFFDEYRRVASARSRGEVADFEELLRLAAISPGSAFHGLAVRTKLRGQILAGEAASIAEVERRLSEAADSVQASIAWLDAGVAFYLQGENLLAEQCLGRALSLRSAEGVIGEPLQQLAKVWTFSLLERGAHEAALSRVLDFRQHEKTRAPWLEDLVRWSQALAVGGTLAPDDVERPRENWGDAVRLFGLLQDDAARRWSWPGAPDAAELLGRVRLEIRRSSETVPVLRVLEALLAKELLGSRDPKLKTLVALAERAARRSADVRAFLYFLRQRFPEEPAFA